MSVKIVIFALFFPIIISVLNSFSVIYSLFSFSGYLIVVSVIVWELTNRLLIQINAYGFRKVNPSKKIILVTGCASGFGYLTAKQLLQYGFTVFAACRTVGENAKRLKTDVGNSEKLVIVACDVTKEEQIDSVYEEVSKYIANGYELWGIVNNAGITVSAEAEWGTFEHNFGNVFAVNCFGVVKVTRKFLPLIRRFKGRVVIVSSILGRYSHSLSVAYSMTKHALISFADGLRQSMNKFGVSVICIEPHFYTTPMITLEKFQIEKLWNETDRSVRNDYGESTFNAVVKLTEPLKSVFASKNCGEVTGAILESLTAPIPNKRQICGPFYIRLLFSILTVIPTDFTFACTLYFEKLFKKCASKFLE